MRRLLALAFALIAATAAGAPALASAPILAVGTPTIYIRNVSKAMTDAQLRNALPALQAQVSQDFAPAWDAGAQLVFIGSAPAPAYAWVLTVNDVSDVQGALGYHTVCNTNGHGSPCGYVSAQTTIDDGNHPTVTLSHELLEMIGDPYVSTMQKVGSRFYIQEVCDAPESEAYAYTRPGADMTPVLLSDFVTPFWFRPGHAGPYDFSGHISRPLQPLPGGYISYWENGAWHQNVKRTKALSQ